MLAADDGQASTLIGGDMPLPLATPPRRLPFRLLFAVAGALLLGLILLLTLAGGSTERPSSSTPSPTVVTVAPTTAPTVPATTVPARTRDTPPNRHHRGGGKKG